MTSAPTETSLQASKLPDSQGHFGEFGGKYVPETLMGALTELEAAYLKLKTDPVFTSELEGLLAEDLPGLPAGR